jgi:hypothetical protein
VVRSANEIGPGATYSGASRKPGQVAIQAQGLDIACLGSVSLLRVLPRARWSTSTSLPFLALSRVSPLLRLVQDRPRHAD